MHLAPLQKVLTALAITVSHPRDDGWMYGVCPFAPFGGHKSATGQKQSFHVKADTKKKSGFNCYVCGRTGNITDLAHMLGALRKKANIPLEHEIILAEADVTSGIEFDSFEMISRPEPLSAGQLKGIYKPAWSAPEAREYLESRLISESTATLLGLLYSGTLGEERLNYNRIMFPVKDRQSRLYGFSGRSTRKDSAAKVQDMLGLKKEFCLLGAEHVPAGTKKPILLVEGLFAYASLYEVGADLYGHPVATLGARMSKWQAEILLDWGLPVYAFYDNDDAGHKGIYGGITESGRRVLGIRDMLKGYPVFIPPWPKNKETGLPLTDPDELLGETVSLMMVHASLLA